MLWLYILSAEGMLLREEPILNKLTDTNTYITPVDAIGRSRVSSDDPYEYYTYEMSDLDGTYGVNARGVFWFDPDGVYQDYPLTTAIVFYSSEQKQYDTPTLYSGW